MYAEPQEFWRISASRSSKNSWVFLSIVLWPPRLYTCRCHAVRDVPQRLYAISVPTLILGANTSEDDAATMFMGRALSLWLSASGRTECL